MIFEYEAVDKNRNSVTGTVKAPNGEEAIMKLLRRGIYPSSLKMLSQEQIRNWQTINRLNRIKNKLENNQEKEIEETNLPEFKPKKQLSETALLLLLIVALLILSAVLK